MSKFALDNVLRDYVSDVWQEIDDLLRGESENQKPKDLEIWMSILGIFQSKADTFGIEREMLGLPSRNADELFIEYVGQV